MRPLSYHHERRCLQAVILVAALVPLTAGAMGMALGVAAFDGLANPSLDSHMRYLSGLLFGLGVSFCCLVPSIERQTTPVRVLAGMVFIGGMARLMGALTLVAPSLPMQLALAMELVVTPLICLWQARIAASRRPELPNQ